MAINQLLIHDYLTSNKFDSIDLLKQNLYKLGIILKDYPKQNMMILYNKFNSDRKKGIELECRSIIVNRTTFDVVNYTCPTPIYNFDAIKYLLQNQDKSKEIYECYEGSLISLFHFEGKWYMSSRRNLNVDKNEQFEMFEEILNLENYTFNDFTSFLNIKYCYNFILIHHKNKNIVNYEKIFGKDYKKLCFVFARDQETLTEINPKDVDNNFMSENIFYPKKLNDESEFDTMNKNCNVNILPESEGIVIKIDNNILKLQSLNYQFHTVLGTDKNIYRGFLKLYQINKLKEYFELNNSNNKITNPLNTAESFDTIGIIDSLFKILTTELFELFKLCWNLDDLTHLNSELYQKLPFEYKNILYKLKGIYYKNKRSINSNNVYVFLKKLDSIKLEEFIRIRKLMINWTINCKDDNEAIEFKKSLYKSKKVLYKLTALYTNKLFPEIMNTDIPTFK